MQKIKWNLFCIRSCGRTTNGIPRGKSTRRWIKRCDTALSIGRGDQSAKE